MTNFKKEINILPRDGEAFLQTLFSIEQSEAYYHSLMKEVEWKQETIFLFGKDILQPRLTAWQSEEGIDYTYSGRTMKSVPFTDTVLQIKQNIESKYSHGFNSVLLNFYRNGNDSMGWHRDNEKDLGVNPVIASVSLGAERVFKFRNYQTKKETRTMLLSSGSVLWMQGEAQHHWEHGLPKSAKIKEGRINLTFRNILQ